MSDLLLIAVVYVRIGLLAFGGGTAVLPEMQRQVVLEQGWLTEREFLDSYALGLLTPGPGMLMALFAGYRVAGLPGALTALAALILPSALLSAVAVARWDALHRSPWLATLQRTFGPLALGLIAAGTYTLLTSVLSNFLSALVAGAGFWLLWRWRLHPALVILAGGVMTGALTLVPG